VGAWLVALALLSLGTVFAIELLQQLFSTDYRAGVQAGAPWPAVRQFGRAWAPGAVTTWLVPLVLLAAGTPLARWAGQRWAAALDAGQGQGAPR
jgi:branched-chain amino acid transport system permease protein